MPWLPTENKTPRDSAQCPMAGPECGRVRFRRCPGPREMQREHPAWLLLNLPLIQVPSPLCEAGRWSGRGGWRATWRGDPGGEQRPGPETHSQVEDVNVAPIGGGRAVQWPVLQHAEAALPAPSLQSYLRRPSPSTWLQQLCKPRALCQQGLSHSTMAWATPGAQAAHQPLTSSTQGACHCGQQVAEQWCLEGAVMEQGSGLWG